MRLRGGSFDDDVCPVVCDNGSCTLRSGFAGDSAPARTFPQLYGRAKRDTHPCFFPPSSACGDDAQRYRGVMRLEYPVERGAIKDWDAATEMWEHMFHNMLRVDPVDTPLLMSEAPLNPRRHRERVAEILFEHFGCPALLFSFSPVLALYSTGHNTGTALDCGDGVTCVMSVYEGFRQPCAVLRNNVAGHDVTDWMGRLLMERGVSIETSAMRDVVRDLKEKLSFVSLDIDKDMKRSLSSTTLDQSYQLPDGSVITLDSERFRCAEMLFTPDVCGLEVDGVHKLVHRSISKCGIDTRRELYANIVLSGGTTMCSGFPDRVRKEITRLAPRRVRPHVSAQPERAMSVWLGGSILASTRRFLRVAVSRAEYDEHGSGITHARGY
eukprot:TRINITY_DN2502_c0_g1_i11.p1 TRINITY_DN2502_c0_g1~~TRINITY_DN2502_c0_g1_i11.p1  ORF type:complete len:382 (+),score=81.09 TRINITY_DN2502_c0_g1_i11:297-1442(+)